MRKEDYLPHEIAKGVTEDGREVWQPRFIKLDTAFRRETLAKLKGCKLSVYLALALHVNDKNQCWPSGETLAKETGYSRKQVFRVIKKLIGLGLIQVDTQGGIFDGKTQANTYSVNSFVRYCGEGWRGESAPESSTGPEQVANVPGHRSQMSQPLGHFEHNNRVANVPLRRLCIKKTSLEEDAPPLSAEGGALRGAKKQPRAARSPLSRAEDEVSLAIAEVIKGKPETIRKDIAFRVRKLLPGKSAEEIASEVRRRFGAGGAWYSADWRGRKGEPPTDAQIFQEWNRMEPTASGAAQDDTASRERFAYHQVAEIHGGA